MIYIYIKCVYTHIYQIYIHILYLLEFVYWETKKFTYLIWMSNKKVFFHPKYQNPLAFFSGACENENMPIPCSATLGVICFQIITNACKYKIVFQLLVFPFKMQTLYVLPKLYRVSLFSINIYILVWNAVFWHFWWFSRALSAPDIFCHYQIRHLKYSLSYNHYIAH